MKLLNLFPVLCIVVLSVLMGIAAVELDRVEGAVMNGQPVYLHGNTYEPYHPTYQRSR